ncbi:hypothetical protein M0805_009154 [Coniferiporia weirii]|nr:hypothetical protein M0805_009154 [Coniferiporia weirii]
MGPPSICPFKPMDRLARSAGSSGISTSSDPELQVFRDSLKIFLLNKYSKLNVTDHVTVNFSEARVAGGSYGEIFVGSLKTEGKGEVRVAVKRLHLYTGSQVEAAKSAAKEIHTWSKLFHLNIVRLFGFYLDGNMFPSIVSEWMENGSVLHYVRHHPECDVIHLILGIAEGLAYLHKNDVVHADIKSDNVLVNSFGDAVICDFGISRMINSSRETLAGNTTLPGGVVGSIRWLSYELLTQSETYKKHTKESDVWAFGMTVYELLTKERPYAHIGIDTQVIISVMKEVLPLPPTSADAWTKKKQEVWKLCESCWKLDPGLRISMTDVVKIMKSIRSRYPEPLVLLRDTLATLSRLNLTKDISIDFSVPKFGGDALNDLFVGKYVIPGRNEVKVAIWRMRPDLRGRSVKVRSPSIISTLRLSHRTGVQLLAKDIYIRSKLAHQNIILLLGFILDESGFPSTVSKWTDNGSVLQFVKDHPEGDVLHLILGIAKGLEYLHENDVVHADIKSDNILVTPAGDAVIRGFEISRAMNATQAFLGGNTTHPNGPAGTVRWMAYELINEAEKYSKHTKESDVWAFGMTVYELLAKERPYADISISAQIIRTVMQQRLPSCPSSFYVWPVKLQEVWGLCEACWTFDPQLRISMSSAVMGLEILR